MSQEFVLSKLSRYTDIMIAPFGTEPNYARLKGQFSALNEDIAEHVVKDLGSSSQDTYNAAIVQAIEKRLEPVAALYQNSPTPWGPSIDALADWGSNREVDYDGIACMNVYHVPVLEFLSHRSLSKEQVSITVVTNYVFEEGELEGALSQYLTGRFNTLQDIAQMVVAIDIGAGAVVVDDLDMKTSERRAVIGMENRDKVALAISEANYRREQHTRTYEEIIRAYEEEHA